MKKLIFLILAVAVVCSAQTPVFSRSELFTAVAAGTTITNIGGRSLYYRINFYPAGAPAACTVAVDSSLDGASWSAGAVIAGQTCTSPGTFTTSTQTAYNYLRINVTALSANKSVTVNVAGYEAYPSGSLPPLTSGSVLFACTTGICQDNANFFWNNAAKRLSLGNSPVGSLYLNASVAGRGPAVLGMGTTSDPVVMWGYNQNPDYSLPVSGEPGLSWTLEGNYNDGSGQNKMEAYLQFLYEDGSGSYVRPFATQLNRVTHLPTETSLSGGTGGVTMYSNAGQGSPGTSQFILGNLMAQFIPTGSAVNVPVTINNTQTVASLATPSITSVTPQTAGGGKTCTYKIVACADAACSFHTAASGAGSTADCADNLATANHGNVLVWPAVVGATGGYNIYRTAFTGTTPAGAAATGKIANVAYGLLSYTDPGANGDAAIPPATDTTGLLSAKYVQIGGTDISLTRISAGLLGIGTGGPISAAASLEFTNGAMLGTMQTYNNVGTVGSGIPSFTGQSAPAAFSTTQTSLSIIASTVASQYRIGYTVYESANGSGGTCNTNATVTPAITYQDPNSQTHTFTAGAISLKPTADAGTEGLNCAAATGSGGCEILRHVKTGTAITITYTYANGNCNTQPQATAKAYAEVVN